jgi:hypothetical protein
MAEEIFQELRRLSRARAVAIEVYYDGGSRILMERWGGGGFTYIAQGKGNLGSRMKRAFEAGFQKGYDRIILTGSDCPSVSREILWKALQALGRHDLVLGPAQDGGYYLIGLKRMIASLFRGIPWGTDRVLARTREQADRGGLGTFLLQTLADVDRPEDLAGYDLRRSG